MSSQDSGNNPIVISPTRNPGPTDQESDSDHGTEPNLISVSVKIICPNEKRADHKTYMLRGLNTEEVNSVVDFREALFAEFGPKLIDSDCEFDFGYYKGTKRIWVRNGQDLEECMQLLRTKSSSMTVWCEGRSRKRKKKALDSSGSDDESNGTKKKKKGASSDDKMSSVDDIVDDLRERHGHAFNNLQYRVWAESVVGRRHTSLDKPPRGSYFKRSTVSPHDRSPVNLEEKSPKVITPIKAAELKTKYISQIKELYSLLESGALTESDFQKQKSKILELMDKV